MIERFSVEVTYRPEANRGGLLTLLTALHRRGIEPLTVSLTDSVGGKRCFRAAFVATPDRARIAAATLRDVVGVAEVDIATDQQ